MLMLGFEYVGNQYGKHKCYRCGTDKSVKYRVRLWDPQIHYAIWDYACNKCVASQITNEIKET